jgi:hypothetical protein
MPHARYFWAPSPVPLEVTVVSPPVAVLAGTWIPLVDFGLHAHLASPSVSLGFDTLALLP